MTTTQTLAAGTSTFFSSLGFKDVVMKPALTTQLMALLGRKGYGKSSIVQSCPRALIINADCSSTVTKGPCKALMWPGVRKNGTPVRPNPQFPNDPEKGTPVVMSWPLIESFVDELVRHAGDPNRPEMIVIDTIDTVVSLLREWWVEEVNKERAERTPPENPATSFADLNAMLYVPKIAEQLSAMVKRLRAAGYGVCMVFHLGDKTKYENRGGVNTSYQVEDEPLVSDSIWNRLVPGLAETSGIVHRYLKEVPVMVPKKGPNGTPILNPQTKKPVLVPTGEKTTEIAVALQFDATPGKYKDACKSRVQMGVVQITPDNPWGCFEQAYNKAVEELYQTEEAPPSTPD
jgi:hypothetical protein